MQTSQRAVQFPVELECRRRARNYSIIAFHIADHRSTNSSTDARRIQCGQR